jgi:transposase
MGKGKEVNYDKRMLIVNLSEEFKQKEIAEMVGVSPSAVSKILKRFSEEGTVGRKPRSGRPRSFTQRDLTRLKKTIRSTTDASFASLSREFLFDGKSTRSPSTVRRCCKLLGMRSFMKRKKASSDSAPQTAAVGFCS